MEQRATIPSFDTSPSDPLKEKQYLTIRCAGERLAIDILAIQEIIEIPHMTQVPKAPVFIRGVINLRGRVVPVVDLCALLTRQRGQIGERSALVLVEVIASSQAQTLGILVDEVDEILDIDPKNMQPAPRLGDAIQTEFIAAMVNVEEQFIILLDINQILSQDELQAVHSLDGETSSSLTQPSPVQNLLPNSHATA